MDFHGKWRHFHQMKHQEYSIFPHLVFGFPKNVCSIYQPSKTNQGHLIELMSFTLSIALRVIIVLISLGSATGSLKTIFRAATFHSM